MAKILIADDSPIMRRNLKKIFTDLGHEIVAEAENGVRAISEYENTNPDIVTIDITMPIMDGIEALKEIIKKDANANIIVISAMSQKRMIIEALESGAKHYIIKPLVFEKVANVINKVLTELDEEDVDIEQEDEEEFSSLPPFEVNNENGVFVITIKENLDNLKVDYLKSTLRGFFVIKPLKLIFDFKNLDIDYDFFMSILDISKEAKNLGGIVKYVIKNRDGIEDLLEESKIEDYIYEDKSSAL